MSFEAKDLVGLSEPAKKLIDVISKGVGVLYEPTRIRRKAKAEAEAQIITANTDIEKSELILRATQRLNFVETRRQSNLDAIISEGFHSLPESVSDTSVDSDWLSSFFVSCQDISNLDMQRIWGKLLAGEVANPGSFSRSTLSILRHIGSREAIILERALQLSWSCGNDLFLIRTFTDFDKLHGQYGVTYDDILQLSSFGLVNSSSSCVVMTSNEDLIYHEKHHKVRPFWLFGKVCISAFIFGNAAKEMAQVVPLTGNEQFYTRSRRFFSRRMCLKKV